jgi:hypothetical protein
MRQVGLTWPGGTRRNLEKEKVDRGSEVRLGSLFVVFVIVFSQKCAVVSARCARRRRPCGQRGARPGAAPVDDSAASDRTTRRRRRDDDASAGDDDAFAEDEDASPSAKDDDASAGDDDAFAKDEDASAEDAPAEDQDASAEVSISILFCFCC